MITKVEGMCQEMANQQMQGVTYWRRNVWETDWSMRYFPLLRAALCLPSSMDHILKYLSPLNLKSSWKSPYWNSREASKRTICIQAPVPFGAYRLLWPRAVVFPETVDSGFVTPRCRSHPKTYPPPSS